MEISEDNVDYLNFVNDCGMDSILFISLLISMEKTFHIRIPDEMVDMEKLSSFSSCSLLLHEMIKTGFDE